MPTLAAIATVTATGAGTGGAAIMVIIDKGLLREGRPPGRLSPGTLLMQNIPMRKPESDNQMKKTLPVFALAGLLLIPAAALQAKEVPGPGAGRIQKQTSYGVNRQGRYVNSSLGNIIIWSPRPQTGYSSGNTVRFARPSPITRAPGTPQIKSPDQHRKSRNYGKQ